ncbi:MAG: hypothetical protein R3Y04_03890 [Rikenellaceae bacterium]
MNKIVSLKLADHILTLDVEIKGLTPNALSAYLPFVCEDDSQNVLCHVNVVDAIEYEIIETLFEEADLSDAMMVRVNVYKTTLGLLYRFILPQSTKVDGELHIVDKSAQIAFTEHSKVSFSNDLVFNNAMIITYITFTLPYNTLLLHASAVLKDGKAHLFLGKSGTGKSTHSRMWLESFPDAELLNDDHPIVRCHGDGRVIAYGSPWSGKTPCYRNLSAPLAAIVRIKRANFNKLTRFGVLKAYGSIMTSCSGVQWSSELSSARAKSIESIITNVACYQMECLPNNDAAKCSYEGLCEEK